MSQHYKIGFHLGPGGNPTGIGDWMRQLDAAAIPFFLKSVDHYGPCFEAMQYTAAAHTVVFRLSRAGQNTGYDFDVPDYALTPTAAAQQHWAQMKLRLPPEFDKRVWLEPINEVDKDRADWLGRFAVEIATLANGEGYRVALFAWSSGEPEAAAWEAAGMVEYLRRCATRPHDCAIALHEYSYTKSDIRHEWPNKIGRFAQLFRTCDRLNIARPKVLITEWGWEYQNVPHEGQAMGDMAWAADLYATYPDILGAAIWYLGSGPQWGDIANQTQRLIAPASQAARSYRYMLPDLPADFPPPTGSGSTPPTPPAAWQPRYTYLFNVYNDYPDDPDWYDVGNAQVPTGWQYRAWQGDNPHGDGQPWNSYHEPENRIVWGAYVPEHEWPLYLNGTRSLRDNKPEPGGFGIHCFSPQGAWRFRYTLPALSVQKGETYRLRLWFHGDWARWIGGVKTAQGLEPDHGQVEIILNGIGAEQFQQVQMVGDNMITTAEWTAPADGDLIAQWGFLTRFANGSEPNGVWVKGVWIEQKLDHSSPLPPTPPIAMPLARTAYTRMTVLIHPGDGAPYAQAVAAATWKNGGRFFTISQSADDAGVAVLYESPSDGILPIQRYVIAVNPERWGEGDDGRGLAGFFERYYGGFGGVNYLPVTAATPADLVRILENFDPVNPPSPAPLPTLTATHWPTNYTVITQAFGNDPDYYRQFGLPGHEGLDIRALHGTPVYAIAPGVVYDVRPTAVPGDNYGIQVRIEHAGGFKSIYAHLKDVRVAKGDTVAGGKQIGRADNTGNSRGDHLHLTIKHDEAAPGGRMYIGYPANIIDPTPILQPLLTPTPTTYRYNGPSVTFSAALHQPASDWEWARPESQYQFTRTGLPVKWLSDGVNANYWAQFNKPSFHLVRVMWKPDRKKTPVEAWDDVKDGVLRFYNTGARKFELHNEPNLSEEGWGTVWNSSDELGAWLREWAILIRQACPLAQLYFPGFSPGVPWTNQFAISARAWSIAKDLLSGFAMHAYTGITNDEVAAANEIITQVEQLQRHLNLQVPLVISEASVNRAASAIYKASVYKRIEAGLRGRPGVEAICWYISSWEQAPPDQVGHQESWAAHGIGQAYTA